MNMKKLANLIFAFLIFLFSSNIVLGADKNKYAALILDSKTGKILHQENAHHPRYPASLVKMMTIYKTFDAIKKQKISLNTKITVSKYAASRPRTNINLKAGSKITVKEALIALIVHSANDAATALSEHLGKTEVDFAKSMTLQARKLKMTKTVFYNSSGLPHAKQKTTAHDMAQLAIALKRDFPEYYHWFSIKEFKYNGITYKSHNNFVKNYAWSDGVKTGFTAASGFNIAVSARLDNRDMVGVLMGGSSAKERDSMLKNLFHKTSKKNFNNNS